MFQYREAVRLRPDFADAWTNLGVSLTEVGRIRESTEAVTKAYELQPTHHLGSNRLLTLLGSSSITAEQLREAHQSWAVKHADPLTPEPGSIRYPDPGPRLKVGYVFDLIHTGATFGFLQSLLTRHDRNRVHVTCYPNAISPSHGTDQLRRLADVWRPIVELPSAQAAETIRADEIDVLVDLWGHYGGNRLLVFARKPARVQLSLFGYPCATGLKAIDFRVTDALADPAGSEPVLRLPNVGRLYVPPLFVPKPNPLPVSSRRTFTFGCLANPARLSEQCLDTWARVLKVVPRSRLVLRTGRSAEAARELTERFTRAGVASDRLEFVFHADEVSYFEAYQPIDAVLDPFPFNGRATTCDALWMGVPVLTVAGTESRSRQGLSILTNIGLADFVADSPEKFVELAATWAEQRDALAELREGLREMVAASPVTDAEAFTRHLEAAYRTAVS